MKIPAIWGNFSVRDAARTRQFYTMVGMTPDQKTTDPKLVCVFFGDNEFAINFFERGSQIDQYLTADGNSSSEVMFTIPAETEADVKDWVNKVKDAGGVIFKNLERDKDGYYGFGFADPDGHKFNILLMDNM